jgi:hypothetical protein
VLRKTYKNKQFIDSVLKDRSPQDFDDSKSSTECDDSIKIIELRKQVDVLKSSICLLQGDRLLRNHRVLVDALPEI